MWTENQSKYIIPNGFNALMLNNEHVFVPEFISIRVLELLFCILSEWELV